MFKYFWIFAILFVFLCGFLYLGYCIMDVIINYEAKTLFQVVDKIFYYHDVFIISSIIVGGIILLIVAIASLCAYCEMPVY